jgi:UDP-glucuronate 4-epimerase
MPKKVLVTGGAGFIGSHASKKLLDKGYRVVIVDNMNNYYDPKIKKDRLKIFLKDYDFKFYKTDISKYNSLARIFSENKFDIICHLAAQAGVRYSLINPWAYEQSNVLGTLNLLELSRKHKIKKFVYASSSSVYGGNTKLPFCELDKVAKPISLYAATKIATENITYVYHHLFKINIVGLRFFTVYGPWGRPDMACYKFANLIYGGKFIDIYHYGKM